MIDPISLARLTFIKTYLNNEAVRVLGVARRPEYGVTMLPDGRLIDGRWDKQHDTMRTVDHSDFPLSERSYDLLCEAIRIYGCDPKSMEYPTKNEWYYFVADNVEYDFSIKRMDMNLSFHRPPTYRQVEVLLRTIDRYEPTVYIDIYCLEDCEFKWIGVGGELDPQVAREVIFSLRYRYREWGCRL